MRLLWICRVYRSFFLIIHQFKFDFTTYRVIVFSFLKLFLFYLRRETDEIIWQITLPGYPEVQSSPKEDRLQGFREIWQPDFILYIIFKLKLK